MQKLSFQDAVRHAMQLHQARRLPEAEALYRQILRAQPAWGDGFAQLAGLLVEKNELDAAIVALQKAVGANPSQPAMCYSNLGALLDRQNRYEEAAAMYRKAIALRPDYAIAHRNLGDALRKLDQLESAGQSYRTAVQLDPQMADAYVGIGLTLYHRGRYPEALEQFQAALQLNPADVNACLNSVLCYGRLGDRAATEATLRRTIALSPNEPELSSGLVMILNYSNGKDPAVVLNEALEYNRRHVLPLLASHRPHVMSRDANRPLRIGYVSPDFREHSVAFFLEPVLANHDRSQFHITCYAEVEKPDEKTKAFQGYAHQWCSTIGRSDDEVAGQIRTDGIDILIDLAGHTVGNRLGVFARKPAPIQITWLGYPNTTGISTMDYRLTDRFADPPDADRFYTEKLIRLPDAFFVYQPPAIAPAVTPLPMLRNGHVTFGSFNSISKITPEIARLWADILRGFPTARLLIAGVTYAAGDRVRALVEGIDPTRIDIADTLPLVQFLQLFERVDIALDSFPWSGHTTACHALWMGVPVVSLAGPTAVSRAAKSLLANLQLDVRWVADTPDDYVKMAVERADQAEELATLRAGMRQRMQQSALMDAVRFTRDLERQLREVWTQQANTR